MRSKGDIVSRARQEKRSPKTERAIFIAVLSGASFLFFIGFLVRLSFLPVFEINHIYVDGEVTVDEREVIGVVEQVIQGKRFFFFNRANIFLYPESRIESRIESEILRIQSIDIKRRGLHEIVISIIERAPSAKYCGVSEDAPLAECILLDREGLLYAPEHILPGEYFSLYGQAPTPLFGNTLIPPKEFEMLIELKKILEENSYSSHTLFYNDIYSYTFILASSTKLHVPKERSKEAIQNLISAQKEIPDIRTLDYIDLRFENRVYYK